MEPIDSSTDSESSDCNMDFCKELWESQLKDSAKNFGSSNQHKVRDSLQESSQRSLPSARRAAINGHTSSPNHELFAKVTNDASLMEQTKDISSNENKSRSLDGVKHNIVCEPLFEDSATSSETDTDASVDADASVDTDVSADTDDDAYNVTTSKNKKRKIEEEDGVASKIKSAMDDLAAAIRENTKVLERSCPRVYSGEEIYNGLEAMGVGRNVISRAYLFLMEKPEKARAVFGCPFPKRMSILKKLMGASY